MTMMVVVLLIGIDYSDGGENAKHGDSDGGSGGDDCDGSVRRRSESVDSHMCWGLNSH